MKRTLADAETDYNSEPPESYPARFSWLRYWPYGGIVLALIFLITGAVYTLHLQPAPPTPVMPVVLQGQSGTVQSWTLLGTIKELTAEQWRVDSQNIIVEPVTRIIGTPALNHRARITGYIRNGAYVATTIAVGEGAADPSADLILPTVTPPGGPLPDAPGLPTVTPLPTITPGGPTLTPTLPRPTATRRPPPTHTPVRPTHTPLPPAPTATLPVQLPHTPAPTTLPVTPASTTTLPVTPAPTVTLPIQLPHTPYPGVTTTPAMTPQASPTLMFTPQTQPSPTPSPVVPPFKLPSATAEPPTTLTISLPSTTSTVVPSPATSTVVLPPTARTTPTLHPLLTQTSGPLLRQ